MPEENGPQPDYAGYPNLDELVKGYRASGEEAKRLAREKTALEQQLAQRMVPQRDQNGHADPIARLNEYGVPTDALGEFVGLAIKQTLEPLTMGMQARTRVLGRYPDYGKFESEIANHINSDPELSQRYWRMFQADPEAAMEYAMLRYSDVKRAQAPPPPPPVSKKEASVPGNRGTGQSAPSDSQEAIAKQWENYQKTGNPVGYAKARLRQVISDDFLSR